MNPVIYAVVDPTATDPKQRMLPVSGTDNNDGTCSLATVVIASSQSRVKVEPLGKPSAAQKITTSATSAVATLTPDTTRVSIYATKAAYFNIGTGSLVATSTNFFIGDNERLDFNVTAGGKIAAIQDSAAGVIYITELD